MLKQEMQMIHFLFSTKYSYTDMAFVRLFFGQISAIWKNSLSTELLGKNFKMEISKLKTRVKKGVLPVFIVTWFFIYMDLKALFLCRKNLLTELPIMSVPWKPCLDWYIIMENIKRCKFTHLLWEYVAHRWVKGF